MPKFIVNTNISKDEVPESFTGELTQQLSKAMGKPAQVSIQIPSWIFKTFPNMAKENNIPFFFFQQYLAIQISPDQLMSFGGSTDPCAMCFLYSIGKIGEQENKVYSKLLCDLLNKQLKIPSDRIYVSFFEISAGNVGWNNTTFA
ncbi:hypothetical protein QYF61_007568 [Mycteria americana]|uniref:Macrophage migration inhibitory factor n=3 Tax=Neoaves TaxID=3078114 RepID=A0AAN7NK30_MYCAM|nr:hypothetical protein QYF61_007568 [Mycteria americana]